MKYNEQKILNEIKEYIENTYDQHYSGGTDGKIQVQDLLRQLGIDKNLSHAPIPQKVNIDEEILSFEKILPCNSNISRPLHQRE